MRTDSPLQSLTTLLHDLERRSHDGLVTTSISAISTELVEPILSCLGWDVDAPDQIIRNDSRIGVTAHFTLLDEEAHVVSIVQCVSDTAGETEREILFAAANYAESTRIESVIVTNGLEWKFFNVGTINPHKPDFRVDLHLDRLPACAAILTSYLDHCLGSHPCLTTSGQSQPSGWRVGGSTQISLDESTSVPRSRRHYLNKQTDEWLTLPQVAEIVTYSKPSRFRLPDERELALKTWREVLVAACEFTLEQNPYLALPFRDVSANSINLMSLAQEYQTSKVAVIDIAEKRVFVYIHYSARAALANIAHVLRAAEFPDRVEPAVILDAVRSSASRRQFREDSAATYTPGGVDEQLTSRTLTMEFDG